VLDTQPPSAKLAEPFMKSNFPLMIFQKVSPMLLARELEIVLV